MAWIGLWLAVLVRVMTSTALPGAILLTLAAGWFIGSLVLVIFDRRCDARHRRHHRRPGPVGLSGRVAGSGGRRSQGSTHYVANVDDGRRLSVKVLSDEERSADLLSRLQHWARSRNLGHERPFSSLKQEVKHERCAPSTPTTSASGRPA